MIAIDYSPQALDHGAPHTVGNTLSTHHGADVAHVAHLADSWPHAIDHSAYPHLLDLVLAHADAPALNAFRRASRASLALVEAEYVRRARCVAPHTTTNGEERRWVFPSRGALPPVTRPEIIALLAVHSPSALLLPTPLPPADCRTLAALPSLPHVLRRFAAVRVLDVGPSLDLRAMARLGRLFAGVETVRIVGQLNAPLPFRPHTVVVTTDLGRPEPFRGWLLADSLVVNYTAGTGGALALAFFPPSGFHGPASLTLMFTRCARAEMVAMPHGARLGARLMGDLARVVCDGHRVTLVDWGNVAALFPPGTRGEDVEQLRTWAGQDHKAARRRACVLRLARLALGAAEGAEEGDGGEGPDRVRVLSAEEYRREVGDEVYNDCTVGLGVFGQAFAK